ncbi:MAG: MlaD family protein [Chthoniobacterales bacterium]|nr:MlaD family protein [Chthoniobacterales bacterium]
MSEEARHFQIGLFTLLAILLLVALIILFGGSKAFQKKIYFETYLDTSAAGIDVGAPVRFRGVNIGKVSNISFVFNQYPSEPKSGIYNYVILELEITKPVFPKMFDKFDISSEIKTAVEQGLRARIEPLGITGLNYIELDYLSQRECPPPLPITWTPRYHYIPAAPGQLESILTSVNKIMRDVEKLQLTDMGEQALALLQKLNSSIEQANLGELSSEIRSLISKINDLITDIQTSISDLDAPSLARDIRKTLSAISEATADLQSILNNLEPSLLFRQDDIPATLSNLRAASENLRILSEDLRTNPSRIFFGKPPPPTHLLQPDKPETPNRGRISINR